MHGFFSPKKEVPFSYQHRNTEDDISTSSSPLSKDWELVTSCGVERMSKPDRKNEEGNSQNTWKYREKPKRSIGQSLVCPRVWNLLPKWLIQSWWGFRGCSDSILKGETGCLQDGDPITYPSAPWLWWSPRCSAAHLWRSLYLGLGTGTWWTHNVSQKTLCIYEWKKSNTWTVSSKCVAQWWYGAVEDCPTPPGALSSKCITTMICSVCPSLLKGYIFKWYYLCQYKIIRECAR